MPGVATGWVMVDSTQEPTSTAVELSRTWLEVELALPEVLDAGSYRLAVYSHRAPDKDGPNEDGALVLALADGRAVVAVADGIGGHASGDVAAATALAALAERVSEAAALGRELREGILDGFDLAHHRVNELAGNGGTTLIAIALEGAGARPFHVGDSAALVTGQRGRLKLLTPSHSPVGYAVEAGLLDEEEAIVHEDRHIVSNAIGIGAMKIEIGPIQPMAPLDTMVVGTDGLFDNLRTEEIVESVRKGRIDRVAAQLATSSSERMVSEDPEHPSKPDDLTFIVIRRHRVRRTNTA